MEEIQSTPAEAIKTSPIKKVWHAFSIQSTKVKISLLSLLVAVITIPSLTGFVSNINNTQSLQGHAQVMSTVPSEPRYYTFVSPWQVANPNEPSTPLLVCNKGDLAVSGGLDDVSTPSLAKWITIRSTPFVSNPDIWTLTVLFTGSTQQRYTGKVLCLKNAHFALNPTPTPSLPTPTFTCLGNCPTPPPPTPTPIKPTSFCFGGGCQPTPRPPTPTLMCVGNRCPTPAPH